MKHKTSANLEPNAPHNECIFHCHIEQAMHHAYILALNGLHSFVFSLLYGFVREWLWKAFSSFWISMLSVLYIYLGRVQQPHGMG